MSDRKPMLFAFADEAGGELSKQIAAMKRNGLMGVELRGTEYGNVSDLRPEQAKDINSRLQAEGLRVWSLGSPLGKTNITEPFGPVLEKLKRTLETAEILGAQNIRIFSFYLPRGEQPEKYRSEVIDRLGKMAEIADALHTGVTLCHENEKGIYGDSAERCLDILKNTGVFGIFDPANFVQCSVDTAAAWDMLKDRTRYLHIKDALSDGRVVPAGCGVGNLTKIVKEFISMGGRAMTVEPHLKVFDGLAGLEREGERSQVGEVYAYPSADAAFDAACDAIKEVIEVISA